MIKILFKLYVIFFIVYNYYGYIKNNDDYDFITTPYKYFYENYCNENNQCMYVKFGNIYSFFVYWFVGSFYTLIDLTGYPKFLYKYKTQEDKNVPHVDYKKFLNAVSLVLFNQIVVGYFFANFVIYPLIKLRGNPFSVETIPTFDIVIRDLIIFVICEEFGFYTTHRLFHEFKYLYQKFHKIHHLWVR